MFDLVLRGGRVLDGAANPELLADVAIQSGRIAAVGNGDPTSEEPFVADHRKAFNGLCVLVVGSVEGESGHVKIRATAEGLAPAEVEVTCGCTTER